MWYVGILKSQNMTFWDFEILEIAISQLVGVWMPGIHLKVAESRPNGTPMRQMGPGPGPMGPMGPGPGPNGPMDLMGSGPGPPQGGGTTMEDYRGYACSGAGVVYIYIYIYIYIAVCL